MEFTTNIKVLVFSLVFLAGCSKKHEQSIEIEILNKEFLSLSSIAKPDPYDSIYQEKGKTIYSLSIKNVSDEVYYFNISHFSEMLNGISYYNTYNCNLLITNDNSDTLRIGTRFPQAKNSAMDSICIIESMINKKLDYKNNSVLSYFKKTNNFILHPGEIKIIEGFVTLPVGDDLNSSSIKIEEGNKYFASIFICSDSTDLDNLSKSEIKTIRDNGYKIFHGLIYSKNKVPIKIIH
ncbi:hypothetical protein [Flavobacterium suncheonense]|uniref:Uncharacterized protein n=1 Tax=Flavobacterium suncheonense GH29-5 = DSM 17707 TaxID=1121899 RepID=A0A0A2MCB4_9FLAO|nr:hypothetical protein [Flavobacterium suncheonense]KGO89251.1 hypothetical protein Q764_09305 [Flavobacterium suncheonense GH29-5 = DSM 17707]